MIKFFRKIRYNLMSENKTGKYLKYAIGEIILVMVGILLALQVNNWNEGRKDIKKAHEILIDVKENAEFNIIQFKKDIEENKNVLNSIDILLNNITVTKIYNDSLDRHFRFATWWSTSRWKSSGYEALIFNGVDIIKSKKLRNAIIDLYEISYPEIIENTRLNEGNWSSIFPSFLELMYREPSDFNTVNQHKAKPFNYQEIIESRLYKSFLSFSRSQRFIDIQMREYAIEKNAELIELIDEELNNN
ncbi:DUF6090 family protein [Ichthyenterobacterium sp. W332]|uniref:DUF6090 family protein n=1 Tax=Microcosmobacter mediterraneus TaxID=3075607 RepID=A0ABU2YJJ6_9FLAO|nr:DUF6090 family protein [Ichthyenterobacterium sp. W332]MDT0558333.1 DUF6090 family protein [Ichthyenterobacterium sp. W332]